MLFTSETIVSLTILLLSTPALSAPVPGIGKRDIPEDALKLAHLPRLDDALESPRYIATAPRYVPRSAVSERSIFGAVWDGLTKRMPLLGNPPPFWTPPNTQEDRLPLACAGLNCPGTLKLPAGPPKCQGFGCSILPTGPIGPFKRNPTETVELPKENKAVEAREAGVLPDMSPHKCAGIHCPGNPPNRNNEVANELADGTLDNFHWARHVTTPDTNLDTPGGPIGAKFRLPLNSINNGIMCSGAPGVCDGGRKNMGGGSVFESKN